MVFFSLAFKRNPPPTLPLETFSQWQSTEGKDSWVSLAERQGKKQSSFTVSWYLCWNFCKVQFEGSRSYVDLIFKMNRKHFSQKEKRSLSYSSFHLQYLTQQLHSMNNQIIHPFSNKITFESETEWDQREQDRALQQADHSADVLFHGHQ